MICYFRLKSSVENKRVKCQKKYTFILQISKFGGSRNFDESTTSIPEKESPSQSSFQGPPMRDYYRFPHLVN